MYTLYLYSIIFFICNEKYHLSSHEIGAVQFDSFTTLDQHLIKLLQINLIDRIKVKQPKKNQKKWNNVKMLININILDFVGIKKCAKKCKIIEQRKSSNIVRELKRLLNGWFYTTNLFLSICACPSEEAIFAKANRS